MITVLCPTRKRPELLMQSLRSLVHGEFEVLLYVDDDDPTKYDLAGLAFPVQIVNGPRVGYRKFHVMVNDLCQFARGDWLMLWNDDAIMTTPEWATVINGLDSSKPTVLNFYDPPNRLNNLFPAISMPMYEAMGHFSLSTHCDSWVQDIANNLSIHQPVPGIGCKHVRELIDDETKAESQAAYADTSGLHSSEGMTALLKADEQKIRALLEGHV